MLISVWHNLKNASGEGTEGTSPPSKTTIQIQGALPELDEDQITLLSKVFYIAMAN